MTPKSALRNAQQNRLECATWKRIDNETPTIQGAHNCATFPLCSTTAVRCTRWLAWRLTRWRTAETFCKDVVRRVVQ